MDEEKNKTMFKITNNLIITINTHKLFIHSIIIYYPCTLPNKLIKEFNKQLALGT